MSEYEHSTAKSQSAGNVSVKLMRLFALYENLVRFTMPLCSGIPNRPHPETPISQSNNIVDISGVGLKQFWNLKAHMQDASQLATAHYPETLDRIFVCLSFPLVLSSESHPISRSLVLPRSFLQYGAGSSAGLIPLPFPRSSFFPTKT